MRKSKFQPVSRTALVLLALVALMADVALAQPSCQVPADPVPINPTGRPEEDFPARDHLYVHSSTHLQGAPATTKIAAGLIQRPTDDLADMTSAVVVNNPHPSRSATVTVTFFDHAGTDMSLAAPLACTTPPFTLGPEASRVLAAVPLDPATGCGGEGVGSARITVAAGDPGIVGAVLHHSYCFFGTVCDTDSIPISSTEPPGAAAMEQLQSVQDWQEIWAGPFPLTASATEDIFNGMTPIVSVVNPHQVPIAAEMALVIFSPAAGVSVTVPWRTVAIPANGTWIEATGTPLTQINGFPAPGLWQQLLLTLLTNPTLDLDIAIRVRSLTGEAILGNVLFTDLFGDTASGGTLTLKHRFRMASTVLQGQPESILINPDFSTEPGPEPLIETYVMLANVGSQATSVTLEYFDNKGVLLSTGSVPSLIPGGTLRIVPGAFGYPAGASGSPGFGWMRIRSCNPGDQLIGWSVREILDPPRHHLYRQFPGMGPHEDHFMKAYGEVLMNTAGDEPGKGFPVVVMELERQRKVSSLIRVITAWPGFSTAINDSVANLLDYEWRIFDFGGGACGVGAYPGLPFGAATWTYEDPLTVQTCVSGTGLTASARIDVSHGTVDGINVLGDPLREFLIQGFADGDPPPIRPGGPEEEE